MQHLVSCMAVLAEKSLSHRTRLLHGYASTVDQKRAREKLTISHHNKSLSLKATSDSIRLNITVFSYRYYFFTILGRFIPSDREWHLLGLPRHDAWLCCVWKSLIYGPYGVFTTRVFRLKNSVFFSDRVMCFVYY